MKLYQGRNLEELPPHIYALAESCYSHMIRHLQNQCCVIRSELLWFGLSELSRVKTVGMHRFSSSVANPGQERQRARS